MSLSHCSPLTLMLLLLGCPEPTGSGPDGSSDDTAVDNDEDDDGFTKDDDCDDTNPTVYPGAAEVCDDLDNDCDTVIDWGLRVPADFSTITEAIDAADDGETVCVAAGSYSEPLDFDNKSIVVRGVAGPEHTTLSSDGTGSTIRFPSPEFEPATLSGFTVTGGTGGQGAGIYISQTKVRLEDLVITGNSCGDVADCLGVGLYCEYSDLALERVTIAGNVASAGDEASGSGSSSGTGAYLFACEATFQDVTIADNTSLSSEPLFGMAYGVGLFADQSDLVWSGGRLSGNTSSPAMTYGMGGGAYITASDLAASNLVVADNQIAGASYALGGGLVAYGTSALAATNTIFSANQASSSGGEADGGGLVVYWRSTAELENCEFVSNRCSGLTACNGGAIYGAYATSLTIHNCNVVANAATVGGSLAGYIEALDTTTFSWSNLYDNGDDELGDYSALVGLSNTVSTDPKYRDMASSQATDWDLTLDPTSPCIDAGDPAIRDVDGTTSDIGAHGGPGAADW